MKMTINLLLFESAIAKWVLFDPGGPVIKFKIHIKEIQTLLIYKSFKISLNVL